MASNIICLSRTWSTYNWISQQLSIITINRSVKTTLHSSWFPFEKYLILSNWILSSNRATLTSYLHYNCHQEIVWMSFYWNLWMSIWFQFRFMDHYVFSYKCHNHNTTCPITSWYWMKMPFSIIVCLKGILSTTHKYHKICKTSFHIAFSIKYLLFALYFP